MGTNTRVTKEEELITINIDSFEQSRARLQLQPTPRCKAPPHLASGMGSASPDTEAVGFVSPDL